jgi:hypothetical protein
VDNSLFTMDLDNYFTEDFTVDDFLDIVMAPSIMVPKEENTPPIKPKSPRRKTFGALINELRDEIHDLKLEIEIRDTYIMAMINDLIFKNK